MDTNELMAAAIVTGLALGVLAGTISSYITVEFFHRHTKYQIALQQQDIALQNELLTEQQVLRLNLDNESRIRMEAVTEAEHQLARRTAEAVTALHATGQAFADDTTITDLDWERMPELRDGLDDTVMLPRVEEGL